MRIYVDSVIFIYYLEGAVPLKTRAVTCLDAMWVAGDVAVASDLVRLECRVHPIRRKDAAALAEYDKLFALANVQHVPLTTPVFDRATRIRADHNFKLADALHLAAAVEAGCDRFLTNDTRLSVFRDIAVETLL